MQHTYTHRYIYIYYMYLDICVMCVTYLLHFITNVRPPMS
jgi:hypothetical protein